MDNCENWQEKARDQLSHAAGRQAQNPMMGNLGAGIAQQPAQPKHLNTVEALDCLDEAIMSLQTMRNRVMDGDCIPSTGAGRDVDPPRMPLSEFLVNTPDRIRMQTERIHALIQELSEVLL
jgi:hypothetical protein